MGDRILTWQYCLKTDVMDKQMKAHGPWEMRALTPVKEHRYICGVGRVGTLVGCVAWPLALNPTLL